MLIMMDRMVVDLDLFVMLVVEVEVEAEVAARMIVGDLLSIRILFEALEEIDFPLVVVRDN